MTRFSVSRHFPKVVALSLATAASLASTEALADRRNPLAGQPTVRHRQELREFRLELTPLMGISYLENFNHAVLGGAKLNYHFKDWFAIGGMFAGGTSVRTGVADEILTTLAPAGMPGTCPSDGVPAKAGSPVCGLAERAMNKVTWIAGINAEITPMSGKFSLFSRSFFNYDFYFLGGVGFVNRTNDLPAVRNTDTPQTCKDEAMGTPVRNTPESGGCYGQNQGTLIGPMLGVGFHMFFTPAVALNVEFRDILVSENSSGRDVNFDGRLTGDDKKLGNKFFWTLGVAFYLPWRPNISD